MRSRATLKRAIREFVFAAMTASGTWGCGGTNDWTSANEEAVEAPFGAESEAVTYSGCWGSGGPQTDYVGFTYGTRYCHNYRGGNMVWSGIVRGYLYAGNNWFVCQEWWDDYPNPRVGSATNHWWLYTQGDTGTDSNHGWGWFPATYVSGGNNEEEIPNLRHCSEIPAFPNSTP